MSQVEGDLILFGTLVLDPGLGIGDLVRNSVGLGHPSVQTAAYSLRSDQFGTSPLPPSPPMVKFCDTNTRLPFENSPMGKLHGCLCVVRLFCDFSSHS